MSATLAYRLILLVWSMAPLLVIAQAATPRPIAYRMADSLSFITSPVSQAISVVWNPQCNKYYSYQPGGLAGYQVEAWDETGGLAVYRDNAGNDTRGCWWNPHTQQVECNQYNNLGWINVSLDGDCHPMTHTPANLMIPGTTQPTMQSVGVFDWNTNTVLFYWNGYMHVYSRATAQPIDTIQLHDPTISLQYFTQCMIYTGQANYEVGLYNRIDRQVHLFNRFTGARTGESFLPGGATTSQQFRFSYARNRVWMYRNDTRRWIPYCIWEQPCDDFLPVELLGFNAACNNNTPTLSWATATEHNSSHFLIERSSDAASWDIVGRITSAGHSQYVTEYAWRDAAPLQHSTVYYRLRQVDLDGREEVFPVLALHNCSPDRTSLSVHPNPTEGIVDVRWSDQNGPYTLQELRVLDMHGRPLRAVRVDAETLSMMLDISFLASGTYTLVGIDASGVRTGSALVVRL